MRKRNPDQGLRLAGALMALIGIPLLAGCPPPIDATVATRMGDSVSPSVSISSPAEGAAYSQTLLVQGSASDDGELASVSYTVSGVLGLLASGTATIGAGGSYQFSVDAVAFSGPVAVRVVAADWNGNESAASVSLAQPASSLSSFAADSSNKAVHLSWQAVQGATGYTVYWATGASAPTVSSPGQASLPAGATSYDLTALPNALVHTFLLKAVTAGATYWSGFVKTLPSSSHSFTPLVTAGYRRIELEWDAAEGAPGYEIYRAVDNPSGGYENLAGTVTATSYTDLSVADGHWYYYRIRPAVDGALQSEANGAQTAPLPPTESRVAGASLPIAAKRVRSYSPSAGVTYAYVAGGAAGIAVVDASDPKSPVYRGTMTGLAAALDLEVGTIAGTGYLFVADGTGGLKAYSLASPAAPVLVGTLTGIDARQVALVTQSSRAYAIDATGASRIVSVNIAAPTAMTLAGSGYVNASYDFDTGDLQAVYYSGSASTGYDYVYATGKNLTQSSRGEVIETYTYKVDNSWPYMGSHYDANFNFNKVAAAGSYVYALGTRNAMLEPPPNYALFLLNRYGLSQAGVSADQRGYVAEIRVPASTPVTRVYSVDGIGVQTWNVATPASPAIEENLNTQGAPTGIDIAGSVLCVAAGINLFQTMDVTAPGALPVAATNGSYGLSCVAARGRYAFATSGTGAGSVLRVFDLQNPEAGTNGIPSVAASAAIPYADKVYLSGDYAFVATSAGRLYVVDISNPLAPTVRGYGASPSGQLAGLVVRGDYAYCAGSIGFQVFDVADPDLPILPAMIDAEGMMMTDVAIRGNRAYVTDGSYFQPNSLKIIDIGDPRDPGLVAKALTGAGIIDGVELSGKWAFVSDGIPGAGLYAVDIDEASATFLTDYGPADLEAAGNSYGGPLRLAGSWALAFNGAPQLVLLDASNPVAYGTAPPTVNAGFIEKSVSLGTALADMAVYGRYLLAADTSAGLLVVKLY